MGFEYNKCYVAQLPHITRLRLNEKHILQSTTRRLLVAWPIGKVAGVVVFMVYNKGLF